MTQNRKEIDGSWIESKLRRTQASLERLQRNSPQEGRSIASKSTANELDISNPWKVLRDLSKLSVSLEYLDLIREYCSWEVEWEQEQKLDQTKLILHCVRLSSLLLRFPQQRQRQSSSTECFEVLYQVVSNRYTSIMKKAKSSLSAQIQKILRNSDYPNSSLEDLGQCLKAEEGELSLLRCCCTQLVTLQTIHEHFLLTSASAKSCAHQPWQRIDIVTELCRPIVLRVRYHFTSSLDEFHSSQQGNIEAKLDLSKRYDRIVEWLLSFAREIMKTPLDFIRTHFDDIAHCGYMGANEILMSTSPNDSFLFKLPPPVYIYRYFLREMVLLVRNVLRESHHSKELTQSMTSSTALCTIVSDDVLFSTSMEHMLQFDDYVLHEANKVYDTDSDSSTSIDTILPYIIMVPIPRLTGIIIHHGDRLSRWIELEHDAALNILSAVLLPVDKQDESKLESSIISNTMLPIFVETLASLLHSAHSKCKLAFSPQGNLDAHHSVLIETTPKSSYFLTEFLNRVQVPLIVSYVDVTLAWAKHQVRRISSSVRQLMSSAAPKPWSNATVSWSSNTSNDETNREVMERLVHQCCKMIGGATCISSLLLAQSLYWEDMETRDYFASFYSNNISASNILKRMNDSVFHVSRAMVDDLSSAIVESMIVDDASVASYLMKIHHILEGDSYSHSQFSSVVISPDLVDLLTTIQDLVSCLDHVFHEHNTSVAAAANMLRSSIADGISIRLIDVILSAPEIHSSKGANQLSFDMRAVAQLFSLSDHVKHTNKRYYGSFDRLMDILTLLSLPYQPFSSLRAAFTLLAGVQYESTADYNGIDIALEQLMVDDRIVDQAQDMLRAKELFWLDLRDALVILFKRNS